MIKGIIFDMDGVISDTQKIHSKIESELLAKYEIHIPPEEITQKYAGVRTKEFFDKLLSKQNKKYNIDALVNKKWGKLEKIAPLSVDAINGSINLIKSLYSKKYTMAVASASYSKYVQNVLKTLKIINYFSAIVSGDMVSKGKPNPESFLLAAKKIYLHPSQCLVIEDGINGMQAAKSANMKCIGLVDDINKIYPTKNLVTSLSKITLNYLNQIK